jgi:hypothetical protein
MNNQQTSFKTPDFFLDIISDENHNAHFLCLEFISLVKTFIILHGENVLSDSACPFRSELKGMVFATRCLTGNSDLHHQMSVVLDDVFRFDDFIVSIRNLSDLENSAVVATLSPDSAVLENAVVKTAQGTTYSNLVPEQYAEKIYIGSKRSCKPILKFYRKDISLLRFETERVGG